MTVKPFYKKSNNLLISLLEHFIKDGKLINASVTKVLSGACAFLLIVSVISYTLVLYQENALVKLHKQTSLMQMDNVEYKTRVDFAKSLYNVQNKAEVLSFLHKPDKVIEIDLKNSKIDVSIDKMANKPDERVVSGY